MRKSYMDVSLTVIQEQLVMEYMQSLLILHCIFTLYALSVSHNNCFTVQQPVTGKYKIVLYIALCLLDFTVIPRIVSINLTCSLTVIDGTEQKFADGNILPSIM